MEKILEQLRPWLERTPSPFLPVQQLVEVRDAARELRNARYEDRAKFFIPLWDALEQIDTIDNVAIYDLVRALEVEEQLVEKEPGENGAIEVTKGSCWLTRNHGTKGKWVEVTVLETDVPRKNGLQHLVRMSYSPMSARWYVDEKDLRPVGHPDTKSSLSIVDDGPHSMTEGQWDYLLSKKEDAKEKG